MPVIPVIPPTTALVSTPVPFNASGLRETVGVVASGLAAAEKVTVLVGGSNGWGPMFENNAQVFLTATAPQASLLPGMHYAFTKEATAAPVSVDVIATL